LATPSAPAERVERGAEQVPVQRAVGHVLVDEQLPAAALGAEAEQVDQIDVLDGAQRAHLRAELLSRLAGAPPAS